jgi:hypothetical protein
MHMSGDGTADPVSASRRVGMGWDGNGTVPLVSLSGSAADPECLNPILGGLRMLTDYES